MNEEWRSIPSYPDYQVSSLGRVRRATPYRSTAVGRCLTLSEDKRTGHLVARMSIRGKLKGVGVHRLMAEAFHGPAPSPKHVAAHGDSNPKHNVPGNIRWATNKENMDDRIALGTAPIGMNNPNARLTDEEVLLIRSHLMFGERPATLSRIFNIPDTLVHNIKSRKLWRHLEF
jgi:hypothetical protein